MELNNVRQLYDYNRWADRRSLRVASTLAGDDFLRPMGNSFSSVRDTLAHILGAAWIYMERWQGRSPKALLNPETFPTVEYWFAPGGLPVFFPIFSAAPYPEVEGWQQTRAAPTGSRTC